MRELLSGDRRQEILDYILDRYEISPSVFENFVFLRSSKCVWLVPKDLYEICAGMKVDKIGLRFLSGREFPYKPTYLFAREFGHLAKIRVLEIEPDDIEKFFQRESYYRETELDGYHLVHYKNDFIGTALVRDGLVESQLPKSLCTHIEAGRSG